MKILLVSPMNNAHYPIPDVGIGYVASSLIKKGNNDVSILSWERKRMSPEKFVNYFNGVPYDVVGIKVFPGSIHNTIKTISLIKVIKPETTVIVGGPYPSCDPEGVLNVITKADYALRGESEIGLPLLTEIAKERDKNSYQRIPGLIWRDVNKIRINENKFIDDIDSFGFPAWELFEDSDFKNTGTFITRTSRYAPIITTRGCPFECTYCAGHKITGKKIRKRSIGNVMEEIRFLFLNCGTGEIGIIDDNFAHDRSFVFEFCNEISKMKMYWRCGQGIRLDSLDKDLLSVMKKAGCYSIGVGIESGSQRILDKMKRRLTIEEIKEKVNLIHDTGIDCLGFFIIGYPDETIEDVKKTIRLARELPLLRAAFHYFLPIQGTEIYDHLCKNGKSSIFGHSNSSYEKMGYHPDSISMKKLKSLYREAYSKFYLSPWRFVNILSRLSSLRQLKMVMNFVFRNIYGKTER